MSSLGTTITKFNEADGTCEVQRNSPLTNGTVTRTLKLTRDQFIRWQRGELIQRAMPQLTPDEREFLLTGMSDADWDEEFGDDE